MAKFRGSGRPLAAVGCQTSGQPFFFRTNRVVAITLALVATMDPIDLVLAKFDSVQVQLMEEECIVVNEKDEVIGHDSKKTCMLVHSV